MAQAQSILVPDSPSQQPAACKSLHTTRAPASQTEDRLTNGCYTPPDTLPDTLFARNHCTPGLLRRSQPFPNPTGSQPPTDTELTPTITLVNT